MNPGQLLTITFSPTGTSRKIAEAVARGIGARTSRTLDLTHTAAPEQTLPRDAAAVFAVPVYGGRVAPLALERLKPLRGDRTPAVLLVVYGNRDIGSAAQQLAAMLTEQGFLPVAAGAFVGEHSYSTTDHPIAAGRPDGDDLTRAEAFGRAVREKLVTGMPAPIRSERLRAPRTPLVPILRFIRFVLGYRREQRRNPVVLLPRTDAERCVHCGLCVKCCPNDAIGSGDELHTDANRCIRCCACVKGCPYAARTFRTPFAQALSRSFSRRKPPVTLL